FGAELHAIVVTSPVTHNSRSADRRTGVGWSEFNQDTVFGAEFQAGEDEHTALTDVVCAAVGNSGVIFARDDQSHRKIEAIALPPPKNGSLLDWLRSHLRYSPQVCLRTHGDDHTFSGLSCEGYISPVSAPTCGKIGTLIFGPLGHIRLLCNKSRAG